MRGLPFDRQIGDKIAMAGPRSRGKGFQRTSSLLQGRIRAASETRGFAQSRVLTHWPEIVGEEIAAIARPIEVSYARRGMGATLALLTTGAQAPMLEMQKEQLRAKVNAVYGYNAIAHIRITQTAPVGFSDGQVDFALKQKTQPAAPDPVAQDWAVETAAPVADEGLRAALERLGAQVKARADK